MKALFFMYICPGNQDNPMVGACHFSYNNRRKLTFQYVLLYKLTTFISITTTECIVCFFIYWKIKLRNKGFDVKHLSLHLFLKVAMVTHAKSDIVEK